MAETPDFEKIARLLAGAGRFSGDGAVISEIVEQLRFVWNARGAADIAKIDHELSSMMGAVAAGPYAKNLDRALRKLDR